MSTRAGNTKDSIYSITGGVYRALGVELISRSGFINLDSLDISRATAEDPHISWPIRLFKKSAREQYSPEACNVNGELSLGRGCSSSGSIEVLSDVYIAARRRGGGFLNVVYRWGSFDAQRRSNDSLSIDG